MAENPPPKLDYFAWGLVLGGLLLAGSILSYTPAPRAYPPMVAEGNVFGWPGNWLASNLFEALGYSTYIFLAGCFALAFMMLLCVPLRWQLTRSTGWILLLPASAVILDYFSGQLPQVSSCGDGGSLGAFLHVLGDDFLGKKNALLVLAGSTVVALLLALDQVLVPLCQISWRLVRGLAKYCRFILMVPNRPKNREQVIETVPLEKKSSSSRKKKSSGPALSSDASEPKTVEEIPINHSLTNQVIAEENPSTESLDNAQTPAIMPITRCTAKMEVEAFDDYELPSLNLLDDPESFPFEEHDQHLREQAMLLEKTCKDFSLNVRVVGINTGPVITQYELGLETGLRVHKVTRLADDIALNLKVSSVRMVAPIPGKNTVGVEVPNLHRAVVRLKEVILATGKQASKGRIPLFLGKDSEGRPLVYDLAEMPHLLIAGRTGTGKSVCLNAIILSILMTLRPDEVKMLMIDPKRTELSEYGQLPHLMHPVVTDMKKAEAILSWAVDKMEERYDLLSRAKVRSIDGYNKLTIKEIYKRVNPSSEEQGRIPERLHSIVIIIDEMADLMMERKREVEGHIIRLAQKSRAAGIHLVVATQKPTVDVITGLIKSNLPARICFQVASRTDSRVVLDEMGADKLLGKGDMLFLQPGTSTLIRAQGTYASDEEITRVVEELGCEPEFAEELLRLEETTTGEGGELDEHMKAKDPLYEQAIEIVIREGRGSVSLLQRALGVGYGRAARLIDFMAEDRIVGDYRGSSAREVLYSPEEWQQYRHAGHST